MFRIALALVLVLLSLDIARAQLPPETLDMLKRATVYVRIDAGRATASGSGFLFGKIADQGYIATNSHVIAPARNGSGAPIKVVFNSGTKDQQEFTAEVVGDDESTDLALLAVRSDKLPAFINSAKAIELTETLPVYVLGFPFGEALATSGRNPAITISKGAVSSIRRTEFDRVVAIQIDGGINSGNSGGPVVTTEGDLVGISVAKVRGTAIGFAIPALDLREMLLGRLSTVNLTESSRNDKKVTYTVTGEVIDPLRRMQKVELLFVPKGPGESKPKADSAGDWARISGTVGSFEVKLEGQKLQGEAILELGNSGDAVYWFQASYVRSDGKLIFNQPGEFVVKAKPPAVAANPPRPSSPATDKPSPKTKSASTPKKNVSLVGIGKPRPSANQAAADDDPLFGKVEARAVTTNAALAGMRQALAGAKDIFVTPLQLPAEKLLKTIVYDSDGKHAFLATSAGVIHKVSVPELVEVRRVEIGSCGALAMSKEGLVATHVAKQRLLVIDADTLTIKKAVHMNGVMWVTASPQSSIAFACAARRETMSVVDLSRGEIVDQIPGRSLGDGFFEVGSPTMTPDGKYLFVCSFESLHRLAIKGTSLILEDTGPRIGNDVQGIEISIDSKFVALPTGSGNHEAAGHPRVEIYGTYIYSVADLQSPRVAFNTGPYPRVLSLDPFARLIYAQNSKFQLLVLNTEGVEEGRYNLVRGDAGTREIALHPQGKKMLVLLTKSLVWVEIERN